MKIKTKEPDYDRDIKSRALLNNNVSGYYAYKRQREEYKNTLKMKTEIDILKEEVNDIKSLLAQILEKVSK